MKDSYYFQHDSNARNDPKVKALINKYGLEGYGRFWVLIEMMRESSCYKLEDEDYIWEAIAEQMKIGVQEAKSYVEDCINKFKLLEKNDDGSIYSASLLQRMSKLDVIRAKRQDAALSRWEKDGGI